MVFLISCQKKLENGNVVRNDVNAEVNEGNKDDAIATPVVQEDPDIESMNESKNKLIAFKEKIVYGEKEKKYVIGSPMNDENYTRLAGLYLNTETVLPSVYRSVYEIESSWGLDYSFGRGTTKIDYNVESGKWVIGGDGEALEFQIIESNEDSIVIDRGIKTEPRTEKVVFKDGFIVIGNRRYNKYSGPSDKYSYLKKITEYKERTSAKYNLVPTEDAIKCIGDKPIEILNILKSNDINSLSGFISKDKGLAINLYNATKLTFDQCNADNERYVEAFTRIYNDLNNQYVPNMNKALQFFNKYALYDISVIQDIYPGSIFVEVYVSDNTYICFTFVYEDNDWKLVQIINNVADFA